MESEKPADFSLAQSLLFQSNADTNEELYDHSKGGESAPKPVEASSHFNMTNSLLFPSSSSRTDNCDGGSFDDHQMPDKHNFDMNDSLLFAETQPEEAGCFSQVELNNSNLFSGNKTQRTGFQLPEAKSNERDDLFDEGKEVKLFSGNTIKLKPRRHRTRLANIEELTSLGGESILDMDNLFNQVRERKSMKESTELLRLKKNRNKHKSTLKTAIWSEKYKPMNFMQLCSAGNDKQYRLVLNWLKKWSSVVFGEQFNGDNGDYLGRPHKKILLVHGPSGIGKTASVHLLARQMGYSVQELNAANSMDSLPQASSATGNVFTNASAALKLKIINALTTNTITSNGKPTCLVIDEVDSSINASEIVKVLNELYYADQRSTYNHNSTSMDVGSEKKKKPGKKPFILNRPIICIANDIYSTNSSSRVSGSPMEKLRPLCEIIPFRKPQSSRATSSAKPSGNAIRSVKDHLLKISQNEKLTLDYQQIGEIIEVCEGDLRSCINYLQFNGRTLDPAIYSMRGDKSRGNKDSQMTWFAMVDLLFKRDPQASKEENFNNLLEVILNGSGKSTTSSSGSLDKVVRGCFNRYLDVVHYQDDSLVKPSELSDWLSFYDNIQLENDANNYASLVTMKVWSLFSEINPTRHSNESSLIPNSRNLDFETFEISKQNKALIKVLLENLPLSTKSSLGYGSSESSDGFVCQILPYIDKALSPNLGSGKMKSNHEVATISKCANLIQDFNLRLENHKSVESNFTTLHFSIDWDNIVHFGNFLSPMTIDAQMKIIQSRRQRLFPVFRAEIEKILQAKKAAKTSISGPSRTEKKRELEEDSEKKKKTKFSSSVEFFKDKYEGFSTQVNNNNNGRTKGLNHEATRIWVKYHEGFSNAVKKNIGWAELWSNST